MVNALTDTGFDAEVDTGRVHVQTQWVGGVLISVTHALWNFSTGCTLSF